MTRNSPNEGFARSVVDDVASLVFSSLRLGNVHFGNVDREL
jgi:hypothetical protein